MGNEIKDGTTVVVDDPSTPAIDKTVDLEPDPNKDKDKDKDKSKGAIMDAAKEDTKAIMKVLEDFEIETPEQLKDFMSDMANLEDQIGDNDLEELKQNSSLLKKYQKLWAEEEEKKLEADETPEETIARHKKQNADLKARMKAERDAKNEEVESTALLNTFGKLVNKAVAKHESVPEQYRPFLAEFLGVDNPINEIDLADKAAINKITASAVKKLQKFQQLVIKDYKAGKTTVPDITPSTPASKTTKPIKTIREAGKVAIARLKEQWKE